MVETEENKEALTLKGLRGSKELTQKELANLLGVSERTIHNMENDSSNMKRWLLDMYLNFFHVKYEDIFLG